ncbi:C45 family peptidase [Vaginella massiliensis]|uniref:C45 family peptidase n=1 Tax=Vaginella massiliensis TaxID=1816680 RepID=UPI000837D6EF|nr:C45 family peptidase [Vaginella massiliensis]
MQYWLLISLAFLFSSCGINRSLKQTPNIGFYPKSTHQLIVHSDSLRTIDHNFLRKNRAGNWEMYLDGNAYDLGTKNGLLTQDLYQNQESIFFEGVQQLLGDKKKTGFLNFFLRWFNRDIQKHISEEYKTEIFALSQFSNPDFDSIAKPYPRALYLHAAHDIGHAMNDLMIVGCSSFAVWDENSMDGELLVGRNFDFYLNDDFAENKVVQFVQPENGYAYLSIGWPGFVGVTSGMNVEGLSVTINAGKSSIPLKAKTPIALLVREILQYAKTIEEAIAIAKTREVFVSESLMISSAFDRKAILIERSPKKIGIVQPSGSWLISTNHFLSSPFEADKRNQKHIANSHSAYRYQILEQEIHDLKPFDDQKVVQVLRNLKGLNHQDIGLGNEKALNQLLAHHAVVFRPEKKLVYVSSAPYNMGEFTVYDLTKLQEKMYPTVKIVVDSLRVPQHPFVLTKAFEQYELFKKKRLTIHRAHERKTALDNGFIEQYVATNPEFWQVYYDAGINAKLQGDLAKAEKYFLLARSKEVTTKSDWHSIEKQIRKVQKKKR